MSRGSGSKKKSIGCDEAGSSCEASSAAAGTGSTSLTVTVCTSGETNAL